MGRCFIPSPILFLLLGVSCAAFGQQATVLGITGTWKLGGRQLHFGSEVARTAILACSPGATLMIAVESGQTPAHLFGKCGDHDQLDLKTLEQKADSNGLLVKLWSAVRSNKNHTAGLIAAVSRGEGGLMDAVVPVRDGKVDLTAALRGAEPGSLKLRATPVGVGSAIEVTASKTAGAPVLVSAAKFRPGLYKVTLPNSADPEYDAWVLVCSAAAYPKVSAQYREARDAALTTWEDLGTAGTLPMLRAYLESLAEGAR